MKTKLSLFIFALLAISIYSCKKEDKNSPVEASALFFAVDSLIGKIDLKNSNAISDFAKGSSSGFTHETVYGMALNPNTGELYCGMQYPDGAIYKVSTTGVATLIYSGLETDAISALAYNSTNNRIYWLNENNDRIYSISASGGIPSALYGGADVDADGYSIQLDEENGKLYYANFDEIKVGNLDGNGTPVILYTDITDTIESPSNIVLNIAENKIYWTDEGADVVASANLDGTGNFKILFNNATHGVDRSDGLAIDFVAKKIYWTETDADRIRVGNLDGTGTPVTLIPNIACYSLLLK